MIWDAAVRRGWNTIRGSVSAAQAKEIERPVIYGGVMWGQRVADTLGVDLAWPPDDWLVGMPYAYTKRWIKQVTGKEARNLEFPVFLKSLNWKDIASRTYFSLDDLPPNLDDDKLYLAAEVVKFEEEYRAFFMNGDIITIGPYAKDGLLNYESSRAAVAEAFILMSNSQTSGLPPCAIDVGYVKGRGWAFVEANAAWCSGIYSNNADAVLDVVAACTLTKARNM